MFETTQLPTRITKKVAPLEGLAPIELINGPVTIKGNFCTAPSARTYFRDLTIEVRTSGERAVTASMPMVVGAGVIKVQTILSSIASSQEFATSVKSAGKIISSLEELLHVINDKGPSQAGWRKQKRYFLMLMRERILSDAMISDLHRGIDPEKLLTERAKRVLRPTPIRLKKILLRDCVGFTAGEALCVTAILQKRGHGVEPIDIRGVRHLGDAIGHDGVPYRRVLLWRLLERIAEANGISDFTKPEQFKDLLSHVSLRTFNTLPITKRGANFSVLLRQCYEGSPAVAILDLIESDSRLAQIKKKGIRAFDFNCAPQNTWTDGKGMPTEAARDIVEVYLKALGKHLKLKNITTVDNFKVLVKHLGKDITIDDPITFWGTNLHSAIRRAYGDSLSAGIMDLVASRKKYSAIADADLRDFSLPRAAARGSIVEGGAPTSVARLMVRRFVTQVAERHGLDPTTIEGFRAVLQNLRARDLTGPLDDWGRKTSALLRDAYKGSSINAVLDLIQHDPDFAIIKKAGVKPYDFHRCRQGYWSNQKTGVPGPGARLVGELLLETLAGPSRRAHLTDRETFLCVARELLESSVYYRPLNVWGTTALRCLRNAYNGDRTLVLKDLVRIGGKYAYASQWVEDISGIPTPSVL